MEHIRKLGAAGKTEREARAEVDRWIDDRELTGDFVLPFDKPALAGTTVAAVLATPARYLGEHMADPHEDLSYGRNKAMLLQRADGSLFVRSFAHGGLNYELKAAASSSQWIWEGEVRTEEARKWLVGNLLPESGIGLISGQWGTYKTFLAMDLAAAVMTGDDFIKYPVIRRGGVLMFACEGQNEVAIRIRAAYEARRGEGKAPFAWQEMSPRLLDPASATTIVSMIKTAAEKMQRVFGLPVALVIFDTAGKAAGYSKAGEENDAALAKVIMKALGTVAIQTNTFVMALAHFGKNAETGTRGSSSYEDDADVVLAALAEKSIGGAISQTRLAARKRRSGPNGEEYAFRINKVDMGVDQWGIKLDTLTIEWLEEPPVGPAGSKPDKPDRWSKKSLRALRQAMMAVLADRGQEIRPWADGPCLRAVDLEIVRDEFYRGYPAAEATDAEGKKAARRQAFFRAIKAAKEDSLIGSWEMGGTTFMWLIDQTPPSIQEEVPV